MQSADCKLKNLQVRKMFIEHKTITKRGKKNEIRGSVRNTFSPSSCGFKLKFKTWRDQASANQKQPTMPTSVTRRQVRLIFIRVRRQTSLDCRSRHLLTFFLQWMKINLDKLNCFSVFFGATEMKMSTFNLNLCFWELRFTDKENQVDVR